MTNDLEETFFSGLRKDFPMLAKEMHGHPLIYFDSAATAQKPIGVISGLSDFYSNHYGTVHRAVYDLATHATENYQQARETVRAFINAEDSAEIIFTRGATESINLVAYSFGKAFIKAGDEILISELEHHSNIVPWQTLREDRGAVIKVIPLKENGELDLEIYESLLNEKTKIVALSHVSNSLGTVNPLKQMISSAHRCGAKVLVDGAQAAPHLPIDVTDLDADFYVFSGHKTYGPTGIGILYGKRALLEAMPPYQGGGDMIKSVTFEKTEYNELPIKFEAGTPMIAQVMGLDLAIKYLQTIGMERIHTREGSLLQHATVAMSGIEGLKIIGNAKDKGAIISFVVDGVHPLDIGTMLDLQGVAVRTGHHCTQPVMHHFGISGTTRASFGLYNTRDEIDRFIEILKSVIEQLK